MDEESIAGVLGFVLLTLGGEVRIPIETIEGGLPERSGVRVQVEDDEVIISIASQEEDEQ